MIQAWLILGNQLFPEHLSKSNRPALVFMAEDHGLCTHFKYHKHKLILFLASMRRFSQELTELGAKVHYDALSEGNKHLSYENKLEAFLKKNHVNSLICYEIEDKFMEKRLVDFCRKKKIDLEIKQSPMFLTNRQEFKDYLGSSKKPFMKTFYEKQRKRLNILVNKNGTPMGGKWSFDTENRKKLPSDLDIPLLPSIKPNETVKQVQALIDSLFSDHPGNSHNFWLPTSRKEALAWLDAFVKQRLCFFGDYEDAMVEGSDFVFHSVLTPVLNLGLITPQEIIHFTLKEAQKRKIPINSLEGFIRQVIGWREFIRGIYQNFSEEQDTRNFWNHKRQLSPSWYKGNTGIPPLDQAISKTVRLGYAHHIERLMVLGNFMLLCEVSPQEAHRWFMEMFVDSSDWVMGPNVYGMALFSDGGIFSTKPYFCGSNYLLKMSDHKKGPWCDIVDGLFWSFIKKHHSFFLKNPRLGMMARALDKIKPDRLAHITEQADHFKNKFCPC
jgi:deoxyribodipyrimidine photolyase-related protein